MIRSLALVLLAASCAPAQEWRAGLAKAVITPREPIWMAGFATRTKPSEGVRQDLYVKALALEDSTGRIFVIVTADLLGLSRASSDEVARRCGLPRERLVLSYSHTHSGPVTDQLDRPSYMLDEHNSEVIRRYTRGLLDQTVETVRGAVRGLSPATLSFSQGLAGFAVNRRRYFDRGFPGPVDHDVPVLAVRDPGGRLRAVLAGYACHATVLNDYQINGDWPGFFKEEFERAHPGTEALFVAGCGADANALPRNSVELARTYGRIFAAAVDQVVRGKMTPLAGPIEGAFEAVDLPFGPPPSREQLQSELTHATAARRNNAARLLRILDSGGKLPGHYPYPIQVWRFGKALNWIVLASEVVVDYSLRLKAQHGWNNTWVSAYANDYCGYMPSLRVLKEGGYEGGGAMAAQGHPGPWRKRRRPHPREGRRAGAAHIGEGFQMTAKTFSAILFMLAALCGCARTGSQPAAATPKKLVARAFNSGFEAAHDSYNGVSCASDGRIYYVLCTDRPDLGAQMFSYDPAADKITRLGDLTEACGEKGLNAVCQGKSHVNFIEAGGKLYFATHIGYYTPGAGGRDVMGVPPPGMKPYPGGHFLSYDMKTGKFEDLAINPNRDGIISMTMDTGRGRLYGLTWPTGHFLRYDLAKRELRDLGPIPGQSADAPIYRALCRALIVDPQDGSVYFTTVDGLILRYVYARDALETVQGEDMKKDYFGLYDADKPGHMGYNWRQVVWYPPERMIYGVHGNSGYLFRFDPRAPRIEVLERLTSMPSRRSGMYDQFSFGYLGFTLGPDGHTLYYLTGGPIYINGKRVVGKAATAKGEAKGLENLHLVTYHIPSARYTDHGPVFFEDGGIPTYVNTIAVGKDGAVYAVARVPAGGRVRGDLIRIPPIQGAR